MDVDVLAFPVSGHDGAAIDENGGNVEPSDSHHRAGHVFVACRHDDQTVHALAEGHGFDGICDDLAADQRRFHALGAHRDAVANRDSAKEEGNAVGGSQAFLHFARLPVQMDVAGRDVRCQIRHGHKRLVHVIVIESGGPKHGPRGGSVWAVCDDAALLLQVQLGFYCHARPSSLFSACQIISASRARAEECFGFMALTNQLECNRDDCRDLTTF